MEKQSNRGSLGMHRGSRVISKVQPPKIRIIHIFPPEIIETDEAHFRDLVQSLTGKHATHKGKRVKKQPPKATISCDNPTAVVVVDPKIEVMTPPGSSSSSDHHHHHHHDWRPSSSLSSSGDDHDHHNKMTSSGGGYLLTLDEVDDVFDFTSIFNMDPSPNHLNPFGHILF